MDVLTRQALALEMMEIMAAALRELAQVKPGPDAEQTARAVRDRAREALRRAEEAA